MEPMLLKGAELIFSKNVNFLERVLASFSQADKIYIITYSLPSTGGEVYDTLKKIKIGCDVHIITNVPCHNSLRFLNRSNADYENQMKSAVKDIQMQVKKLNCKYHPEIDFRFSYNENYHFHLLLENHIKLVMTDKIAYFGSGNYTNASRNNFELGVITENPDDLEKLEKIAEELIQKSEQYYDEESKRIIKDFQCMDLFVEKAKSDLYEIEEIDDKKEIFFPDAINLEFAKHIIEQIIENIKRISDYFHNNMSVIDKEMYKKALEIENMAEEYNIHFTHFYLSELINAISDKKIQNGYLEEKVPSTNEGTISRINALNALKEMCNDLDRIMIQYFAAFELVWPYLTNKKLFYTE